MSGVAPVSDGAGTDVGVKQPSLNAVDRSFRRKKNNLQRRITFNLKPTEVPIASDVQNAMFLQKVQASNKRTTPHALTFMPRIFTPGFYRRNSSPSNPPDPSTPDKSSGGGPPPSNSSTP